MECVQFKLTVTISTGNTVREYNAFEVISFIKNCGMDASLCWDDEEQSRGMFLRVETSENCFLHMRLGDYIVKDEGRVYLLVPDAEIDLKECDIK